MSASLTLTFSRPNRPSHRASCREYKLLPTWEKYVLCSRNERGLHLDDIVTSLATVSEHEHASYVIDQRRKHPNDQRVLSRRSVVVEKPHCFCLLAAEPRSPKRRSFVLPLLRVTPPPRGRLFAAVHAFDSAARRVQQSCPHPEQNQPTPLIAPHPRSTACS